MKNILILACAILLFSCSKKVTQPAIITNAAPQALPIVETFDPVNELFMPDIDIPFMQVRVKISGYFEQKGNIQNSKIGFIYSQVHSNLQLSTNEVKVVEYNFTGNNTVYEYTYPFEGLNLYVRAYAENKHGVSYGNIKTFTPCKRPQGLNPFELNYLAIDNNGNKLFFYKSLDEAKQIAKDWLDEKSGLVEMKGIVGYTVGLEEGFQIYADDNNTCSTFADGFYFYFEKFPVKIIYIQKGIIAGVY